MRVLRAEELGKVRQEVSQLLAEHACQTSTLRELEAELGHVRQQGMSWKQLWHSTMATNLTLVRRLSLHEPVSQVSFAHSSCKLKSVVPIIPEL